MATFVVHSMYGEPIDVCTEPRLAATAGFCRWSA